MIAFVSGSYKGETKNEIDNNIEQAAIVAQKLWEMGYAVICPQKNTGHFIGNRDIFLSGYIEILGKCNIIVMLHNWVDSDGARIEWNKAKVFNVPIFYWTSDQDKIREFLKTSLEEGTI